MEPNDNIIQKDPENSFGPPQETSFSNQDNKQGSLEVAEEGTDKPLIRDLRPTQKNDISPLRFESRSRELIQNNEESPEKEKRGRIPEDQDEDIGEGGYSPGEYYPREVTEDYQIERGVTNLTNGDEVESPNTVKKLNTSVNETRRLLYTIQDEENEDKAKGKKVVLKKSPTLQQTRNEMKENYLEHMDLLPEGVESIDELRKLYEEKRMMKRTSHLNFIPRAHEDEISCLVFTPNYKSIISGSKDHSIKVFDVKTKQQIYHIKEAHDDGVMALAMTRDGKYLISGSVDKSIKIFDFATKNLVHHFQNAHEGCICSLTVTSDNKYLVSGSWDYSIKIFDLNEKRQVHHFKDIHKDQVNSVKVTSDNKYIISGSDDRSIKIFDLPARKEIFAFEDIHDDTINSIAITPDNKYVVSASKDSSVKILDISARKEVHCFREGIEHGVSEIALSPSGQYIFAGIANGSIIMWDINTKEKIKQFNDVHTKGFSGLAVSKEADFLLSCSADKFLEVTEIQDKEKTFTYWKTAHSGSLSSIIWTPDSQYFISGSHDYSAAIFDSETKEETYRFQDLGQVASLLLTPNGKYFISASWSGTLKIFDFQSHQEHHCSHYEYAMGSLAATIDSKYIIFPQDKSLQIFDIEAKEVVHNIPDLHKGAINGVAVTPDNRFVITCSDDKSIKMVDVATRQETYHFKQAHNDEIFAIDVTPNNKYIISSSRDFSIKMFDIETKRQIYDFVHAHDNSIMTLSISSDSRYVASGSSDESVRVFDLETRQLVYYLPNAHNDWVFAVAFSPNKKYLASGARDGSMKLFNFETIMEDYEISSPFKYGEISAVAISPNSQIIVAGSSSADVAGFDMETKNKLLDLPSVYRRKIKSITVSADNKLIITGFEDGTLEIIDIETAQVAHSLKGAHKDAIYAVAVTPDNKFLVSGSKDKSIKIMDLKTQEIYHHFKEIHEEMIRSVDITSNSRYILSASTDKSIKILDIVEKKEIYHFVGAHPRWIKAVAVSSDGNLIATCSDDRSIRLFDFKTKQLVHRFKDAHDDFTETLAISKDCRFIVSGSRDKSIKIFDIQTKQQVHHFKNVHGDRIKSVVISSDNEYIVSGSYDGNIRIFKLTPTPPLPKQPQAPFNQGITTNKGLQVSDSEIYYVYNGLSKYSKFNAVDDFLFNPNMPIRTVNATAIRCQNLTVYPYAWNILHLVAIKAHHNFIKYMPEYTDFKVPFLLDAFDKTPLHYLVAHTNINSTSVNIILTYICDYLDGLNQYQQYQAQEIIISLTPLFWFILVKTDVKIRERFLTIAFIATPIPYNTELPAFGKPTTDKAYFHPTLESIYHSIKDTWKKGEDQLDFRTNIIKIDYNVLSLDMNKTIKCLSKQKNEEIFKTRIITNLIDHLWDQIKLFLHINFFIFSAYIIALSVYLSLEDRCLPYEIIIFCLAGLFLFAEGLQVATVKQDYLKEPWNWIDVIFHPLTVAYVISRMLGTDDELTRGWISTMIILFGYLRWISYLRIFKPTRSLIQVVVTVVNDMKSFIIIIALIIIGFSFIFLVFNRGRLYGYYLYNSYGSLYGPVDDEDSSPSEKFFIALIAFLLNVILLNLLISIMGDSYERVLEKRIKTDSLTRLDMISEAVTLVKFLGRKKALTRGFLMFCLSVDSANDDDEGEDEWEGKITMFRKFFKQSEELTEKGITKLEQDLTTKLEKHRKINDERLEQKMQAIEEKLERARLEYEEKTNSILNLLTEMKEQKQQQQSIGQVENQN